MKKAISIMLVTLLFVACKKDLSPDQQALIDASVQPANAKSKSVLIDSVNLLNAKSNIGLGEEEGSSAGHVYTLSNATSGNKVIDYKRGADGKLIYLASYPTGGNGTGGGLGNQGAVILTDEKEDLIAVNAGSNTISLFKVSGNGLQLKSTINSGGIKPISITQHEDLVFVLNAGGNGNIAGFKLDDNKLTAISNSSRPLSSSTAGAAEISFVNNGKIVVVTEKATNKIISYTINEDGIAGAFHSITSANSTPFGFAVGRNGHIYVSEAAGGAPNASTVSSYHVNYNGEITLVTGPVPTNQSAACWVVLTDNDKYAYTTNTGSNTLSVFNTNNWGGLSLSSSIAALTESGPIDAALSDESKFLYILNSGSHSITVYVVGNNGALNSLQSVSGLIPGANGLAAK